MKFILRAVMTVAVFAIPASVQAWSYGVSTDDFTRETSHHADSKTKIHHTPGGEVVVSMVRVSGCGGGVRVHLMFSSGAHIQSPHVQFRTDGSSVMSAEGVLEHPSVGSTQASMLTLMPGRHADRFLKLMYQSGPADSLRLRLQGMSVDPVFPLAGFKSAVGKVLKACNYKLPN
ncbi:MAG: hypothetical protein MPJ81_06670 [Gammaproteobacteria bacterium]|nr:hypothetical protein [Gammaproteobacteria bacterium]